MTNLARQAGNTIFTIGHGARSEAEFYEVLSGAEIGMVADVRRHPGSRRHPQFARDALEESLPRGGIAYEWWGEAMGGRRRWTTAPSTVTSRGVTVGAKAPN